MRAMNVEVSSRGSSRWRERAAMLRLATTCRIRGFAVGANQKRHRAHAEFEDAWRRRERPKTKPRSVAFARRRRRGSGGAITSTISSVGFATCGRSLLGTNAPPAGDAGRLTRGTAVVPIVGLATGVSFWWHLVRIAVRSVPSPFAPKLASESARCAIGIHFNRDTCACIAARAAF